MRAVVPAAVVNQEGAQVVPPQSVPAPPQPAPAQDPTPPGWYPDPTGRHQLRYWGGTAWTESVADGGTQSTDPMPT